MKALVVEDDAALSTFLQRSLQEQDYDARAVNDGMAATEELLTFEPDLLLLDLGLPKLDGVEVLRLALEALPSVSVIILTGRSQVASKIECLNLGADDYLVKPFSLHELLARCRAVRRRRSGSETGNVLRHQTLTMNRMTREVTLAGKQVELTAKEFTLLEYLLLQRGRAVPRQELLREVWRTTPDTGTNVVDVYINYLRRKLGHDGPDGIIETVRGAGYAIGMKAARPKSALPSLSLPMFSPVGAV